MDAAQVLVLDRFEGSFYAREPVAVRCASGEGLAVEAYVVVPGQRAALTSEAWELEHWRAHHLTRQLRDWGLDRLPAQPSALRNTESR